ncbi:methyltransferase domain-containing protein [Spirosoma sp. HMF4905]|uniref:Methyltransferase domain-containing protein n=1 Tax=Spirosoma arboris TaxID=2682092 RepID=A0A7K1SQI6_9BACT|nr:methyltransferase domain-containing protein [Spirosoma arboris]MVM36068.1 methyltransferase domain-containing protein [Spirosoma arboris]
MNGDFSFDTVQQFDDHIDLSIPTYSNLREAILRLSTSFVKTDSTVYDLGCSTGLLLSLLANQVPGSVRLVGIDVSINLLQQSSDLRIERHRMDLASERFRLTPTDLVFSIFTLQFLPVIARQSVVDKVYEALEPGGAFIVAEKTFIDDGLIQDLFTFGYYDMKLKNFTAEEVLDKQLALRRIMRPQTEPENLKLFTRFARIFPFWQYLHFKAWLCIK